MSAHEAIHPAPRTALAALLCVLAGAPALAQETLVRNDCTADGSFVNVCPCFAAGEEAAVWLTSPCDGSIVQVQILWRSALQNTPQVLQQAIFLYDGSTFPVPGDVLINADGFDAVFEGPVLTDGFMNTFLWLDEQQKVPLSVPVEEGDKFVVSLLFGESNEGDSSAASIASDVHATSPQCPHPQCQPTKNAVKAFGFGWVSSCSLGVSGDWIMRAVVNCAPCAGDIDDNDVVNVSDLLDLIGDWGPCRRCEADLDGNGTVNVTDLLALITNWGPC